MTKAIFEKHSLGKVVVDQDVLLELKNKAKKYDDLMAKQREKDYPDKKQGGK